MFNRNYYCVLATRKKEASRIAPATGSLRLYGVAGAGAIEDYLLDGGQRRAENLVQLIRFMQSGLAYANDRFWPKADIRTKSRSSLMNDRFGKKSGRSWSLEKAQSWKNHDFSTHT